MASVSPGADNLATVFPRIRDVGFHGYGRANAGRRQELTVNDDVMPRSMWNGTSQTIV